MIKIVSNKEPVLIQGNIEGKLFLQKTKSKSTITYQNLKKKMKTAFPLTKSKLKTMALRKISFLLVIYLIIFDYMKKYYAVKLFLIFFRLGFLTSWDAV